MIRESKLRKRKFVLNDMELLEVIKIKVMNFSMYRMYVKMMVVKLMLLIDGIIWCSGLIMGWVVFMINCENGL